MQQWALLADYTRPVLTMGAAYESSQLMVLADFVDKGLVFLDKRPVHWSPASRYDVPIRRTRQGSWRY